MNVKIRRQLAARKKRLDPTTAGDFCRRFEPHHIRTLLDVYHETCVKVWARQPREFFREARIDMDGTLVPTGGECKQDMDISYDGTWGYHPLVLSLANTGEVLSIVNRSGNRPSHEGAADEIDASQMRAMNARAKLDGLPDALVAAEFLEHTFHIRAVRPLDGLASRLPQRTREHLLLVTVSLAAAIIVAVPLGIAAAQRRRLGQMILGVVAAIYTIPALALLVFMIPLLGFGTTPAIVALFLYSLLPIVRNTQAGLQGIPAPVRESAEALGLPWLARLLKVELPMASGAVLAGIKTSAVINVGTATLGALIGAGGYGQPILTGIRLDNTGLVLEGAVPAALLALTVQGLFELAERWLIPKGLRLQVR